MQCIAAAALAMVFFALSAQQTCSANEREEQYRKGRLKQMKAGDWAEFEVIVEIAALKTKLTSVRKITVAKVDDAGVSFKCETTAEGKTETVETRLNFKDRTKEIARKAAPQSAEGNEPVTVAKNEYECTWYEMRLEKDLGAEHNISDKTWYSDDVPLFGLVKRVFVAETNTTTTTTETLKASGRGK